MMCDLNDYIVHTSGSGRKSRRYRSWCPTCGKDKGYIRKARLGIECHACNADSAKEKGKNWDGKEGIREQIVAARKQQIMQPRSEETRQKISHANKATKRRQLLEKHGHIRSPEHRKLRKNFSSLMGCRLKRRLASKQGNSCFDIVGYTIDDLIRHLESQFTEGMTWENYGINGWEIDHIVPDAHFKYNSIHDKDFHQCWSLDNLRPMWAVDNRSKKDNLI